MIWFLLVVGAYLLGAVSFSLLIVRAVMGEDIRTHGSGNAGATNVLRTAGRGPAVVALLLDIAKGAVAVYVARLLGAPGPVVGLAAVAAVVGHIFPIYFQFRGGKGVATCCGALGLLAPQAALLAAGVFILVTLSTRYVSLGSILATGTFPLFVFFVGQWGWAALAPGWLLLTSVAICGLILFKHRENVQRILAGTEHQFGTSGDRKKAQ